MYARYIPPAKPKPAAREEQQQPAAEESSGGGAGRGGAATGVRNAAPPPPVPSDAFSYARYVPPAAPAKSPAAVVGGAEEARKRKRDGEAEERGGKKVKAAEGEMDETPTKRKAEKKVQGEDAVAESGGAVKVAAEHAAAGGKTPMTEEERERRKVEKKKKREDRRRKPEEEDAATPSKPAATQPDAANVETPTPRKSKKSKGSLPNGQPPAEPQDSDVEMTAPADDSPSEPEETKEKTPKKEKKKKRGESEKVEESGEAEEETPKKDRKKKRREAGDTEQAEEPVARHHKAVLDRRDKALRHVQAPAPASPTPGDTAAPPADESPEVAVHGLQPLPQPERVDLDAAAPSFDGLPPWIADPVRVEESTRATFASLGIPEKVAQALESKGFADAFAVQTAAIPLLLPTSKRAQGDVLVSAATGSGKTLAYAIPIVRDISLGVVTRMRALVVLPTRELVKQAKEAFESVASAFDGQGRKRVRIGIAYGSQSLKAEQGSLVTREEVYDLEASEEARRGGEAGAAAGAGRPVAGALPGHVVSFGSTVDVLICTPGRLVDHIKQTQGFALDYVRWLVVDEGDKLLEQNYQNWIPTVMGALHPPRDPASAHVLGARDFPDSDLSGVRKVFLSATLTSTGSLAAMRELDLRRPRLVMLGGGGRKGADAADHVLPEKLRERAIRLKDESLKPLYLNELLLGPHLRAVDASPPPPSSTSPEPASTTPAAFATTALIFTKSNESALRLSRLLSHLTPSLSPLIATLTSATPPHARRRTLLDFASGALRILVASDLVARGIDLPLLDHVVNYDLPPSVEAYVHRVGRAARAGRGGVAWSLVPDGKEGGWFWGEVAKGRKISRSAAVERVVLEEPGEGRVEEYQTALGELGREAAGKKGGK